MQTRNIQGKICQEDFVKLKMFCVRAGLPLGFVVSRIVHAFVMSPVIEDAHMYKEELFNVLYGKIVESKLGLREYSAKQNALE